MPLLPSPSLLPSPNLLPQSDATSAGSSGGLATLTPQPILRHLLDRLRANYVPVQLYEDTDVLAMLNDAYLETCERSRCLQALTTIILVADQPEYTLPSDFSSAEDVVAGGNQLYPVPLSEALIGSTLTATPQSGYYLYAGKIGFLPAPVDADTATTVMMTYNATPTPFATWDDPLDPRFPVEYADLLVHYVIWRVQMLSGGAESIREAQTNRSISETRMNELRRSIGRTESVSPPQIRHVSDRRRLRPGA